MSAGGGLDLSHCTPVSEAEVADIVRQARDERRAFAVRGGGTRSGTPDGDVLATTGLRGITLYEPSEMVISARAGTPLALVEEALAAHGQMLPFEPHDLRPLLGTEGEPTIGGMAATNASGPRRIATGAARDSLIGARFVNGRGEIVKSGGRVMKNVTGLDLARLMAGSRGRLGVLTEVTFKVSPRPETGATVVLPGLDPGRAVAALSAGLGSPYEVTGAAHLPAGIGETVARTLLRLEGFEASVAHRAEALAALLRPFGPAERLADAAATWLAIKNATLLAAPAEHPVWRLSVAPSNGPGALSMIEARADARGFLDWGGGLVWVALAPSADGGQRALHQAAAQFGRHATLVRAAAGGTGSVGPLPFVPEAVRRLEAGVIAAFDPDGVFSERSYGSS